MLCEIVFAMTSKAKIRTEDQRLFCHGNKIIYQLNYCITSQLTESHFYHYIAMYMHVQ